MENGKQSPDSHFSLCWLENNHQVSIFNSIGCVVKMDQLIRKVNITVITTLETDWPQEPTLIVVINSHVANWILNVGQIVPLSESHCNFVVDFAKMCFRFHFSSVYDLEYYNCFAEYLSQKRKLEWPLNPLTLLEYHTAHCQCHYGPVWQCILCHC